MYIVHTCTKWANKNREAATILPHCNSEYSACWKIPHIICVLFEPQLCTKRYPAPVSIISIILSDQDTCSMAFCQSRKCPTHAATSSEKHCRQSGGWHKRIRPCPKNSPRHGSKNQALGSKDVSHEQTNPFLGTQSWTNQSCEQLADNSKYSNRYLQRTMRWRCLITGHSLGIKLWGKESSRLPLITSASNVRGMNITTMPWHSDCHVCLVDNVLIKTDMIIFK